MRVLKLPFETVSKHEVFVSESQIETLFVTLTVYLKR